MKTASWVILTVVGALVLIGSTVSLWVGYSGTDYPIGTKPLSEIEAAHSGAGAAMRGQRGTAAAYAVAYGILFLAIVLGPYRRREVWAWWAILGATAALAFYTWLRVPTLGIRLGVTTIFMELAVVV